MSTPNYNISPNMQMTVPIPTIEIGPAWAQELYNALYITNDSHNHTPGNGAYINQDSFNFTGDVSLQGYSIDNLLATVYQSQASTISPSTNPYNLYVSGGNLYYNSASTSIQITTASAVNATSSGISDGSGATAAFVSKVLVVNKASNTPGNIQAGSYLMGDGTTDGYFVDIQPPTLTASYPLVLPPLPAATSFLQMTTPGGVITGSIPISGGLTSSNLSASANITGSQLSASAGITGSQLSASAGIVGTQLSASAGIKYSQLQTSYEASGSFGQVVSSPTPTTLTTSVMNFIDAVVNRPMMLTFFGSGPAGASGIFLSNAANLGVNFQKSTDGGTTYTNLAENLLTTTINTGQWTTAGYTFFDYGAVPANVFYRIQVSVSAGTATVQNCQFVAFQF